MKKLMMLVVLTGLSLPLFAETQNYIILRRLSELKFEVSAQVHEVHGQSNVFSGTIAGDPADITSAKINVKLDPTSFDTENDKRDKVMREECLEVSKFAAIEFESKEITADQKQLKPDQPLQATVKGTLKMHGMEKEVSVPVKITLSGENIVAEGEMGVGLDDWQILRPKVLMVQLQNDVKIHFKVGGRKTTTP